MKTSINPRTIKLIEKFIQPLANEGMISEKEFKEVFFHLKKIADSEKTLIDTPRPKLLTQQQVADMLEIGYSSFKTLDAAGHFPFKRRIIGKNSIRYSNLDVIKYILEGV